MKLVVDANILFSFFRDNPVRFIIINSKLLNLELFSPKYSLEELKRNTLDLVKYTESDKSQVESTFVELDKFIKTFSSEEYKEFKSEAGKISPHKSDKDTPYFALALKLRCPIWSNEPKFKDQSSVKVFNTRELSKLLGVSN